MPAKNKLVKTRKTSRKLSAKTSKMTNKTKAHCSQKSVTGAVKSGAGTGKTALSSKPATKRSGAVKSTTGTGGKKKAQAAKKKPAAKKRPAGKKRLPRCKLNKAEIEELFARFAADTPEPTGELNYSNPYTLLVAVALSAQATDVGVNKATRKLFEIVDSPQKMLVLGEEKLRDMIKTIGLYRNKAKNVIAMSERLVDEFGGEVPQDRDSLESLPGVGRKTANVVLNIAFGQPTIAVDTHLFRLGNRTGLAPGKDPLQVELGLLKVIPPHYLRHAHHWLILHGRYVCLARKPRCQVCIIGDICKFKDKTPVPAAPGNA